ncbi:MAG: hypothetical protein JO227_04035 [Acetobacteraceae bacterium]|nr:hypothetical protein [Acetobacteraceae bacterium]
MNAELEPTLAADAAEVTVTMTEGARHTCRITHCTGSASRPMTDAELERKFTGLSEPVLGTLRTREVVEKTWAVEGLPDVGDLARAAA